LLCADNGGGAGAAGVGSASVASRGSTAPVAVGGVGQLAAEPRGVTGLDVDAQPMMTSNAAIHA